MKKLKITFSYVLGGVVLLGVVALAGSLSPQAPVGTTMKTMEDVYQKLTLNTYIPEDHYISTTSSPSQSMHSLADIWSAIPTVSSSTITTGTTIMGIEGTYDISSLTPGNVLAGTNYGVDSVGTLSIDTTPTPLQFSTADGDYTDWNTGGTFCADLVEGGHDDWRLPTYTELVDASPAGDNPVGGFQGDGYWSGTTHPSTADLAYLVYMNDGSAAYDYKDFPGVLVRCAR
jgi:hypothetical protein